MASSPAPLRVAVIQLVAMSSFDAAANDDAAEAAVRACHAATSANLIVLPELFSSPYFPAAGQHPDYYRLAVDGDALVKRFAAVAAELRVVLPVSFYQRRGSVCFNTVVAIDADGAVLGQHDKAHVPDGPGYCEKFYFTPGDSKFPVFQSRVYGWRLGCLVCWEQWQPEPVRCMALDGVDVVVYPTAIGDEPEDGGTDGGVLSRSHWEVVMRGHAGANQVVVAAANRVGRESWAGGSDTAATDAADAAAFTPPPRSTPPTTFYGGSFIAGARGQVLARAGGDDGFDDAATAWCVADVDVLADVRRVRDAWGCFRDRRPELYTRLHGK